MSGLPTIVLAKIDHELLNMEVCVVCTPFSVCLVASKLGISHMLAASLPSIFASQVGHSNCSITQTNHDLHM